MYSYYEIVLRTINDNKLYKLTYVLESHDAAMKWARLINKVNVTMLRSSLNPIRGLDTWDDKINTLNILIALINEWMSNKIAPFSPNDNIVNSLNRLHVHFPEVHKTETDRSRLGQLAAYNDLIHELETMNHGRVHNRKFTYILLCPKGGERIDIDPIDYRYFTPNRRAGELFIHYPHVGRHPLELFVNNDIKCPPDQILPQHKISASHTLRFSDVNIRPVAFKYFYYSSKLVWPYDISDPRLAVGYIKAGTLLHINDAPWQVSDFDSIITPFTQVVEWNVY